MNHHRPIYWLLGSIILAIFLPSFVHVGFYASRSLVAYLVRYANISLDCKGDHPYVLSDKTSDKWLDNRYEKMNIHLHDFVLYERK